MEYRWFGNTDLKVSNIGFGAWGIGGALMAGDTPLGFGKVDDKISIKALEKAFDLGINFYDTADIYGDGHSEELIGKVFGNDDKIVVATKGGNIAGNADQPVRLDYSKKHIIQACEKSLKRLKRETIDFYQLHTAKVDHLKEGECMEALERLKDDGKIKFWGVSLNTFNPEPEARYMIDHQIGHGFQLVFNIINQRSWPIIREASSVGYGIIARMPLQFGLLTGKFNKNTTFEKDDHRAFRLPPDILKQSLDYLDPIWEIANKYNISKTALSLSFIKSFSEISTTIPGIKTPEQAMSNTKDVITLDPEDKQYLMEYYNNDLYKVLELMQG